MRRWFCPAPPCLLHPWEHVTARVPRVVFGSWCKNLWSPPVGSSPPGRYHAACPWGGVLGVREVWGVRTSRSELLHRLFPFPTSFACACCRGLHISPPVPTPLHSRAMCIVGWPRAGPHVTTGCCRGVPPSRVAPLGYGQLALALVRWWLHGFLYGGNTLGACSAGQVPAVVSLVPIPWPPLRGGLCGITWGSLPPRCGECRLTARGTATYPIVPFPVGASPFVPRWVLGWRFCAWGGLVWVVVGVFRWPFPVLLGLP